MNPTNQTSACQRILLVDDEESFRVSTAELLRQEGYDVEVAASSQEAVALLQGARFSLVITDINMTGNQHLEFVGAIAEAHPDLPLIIVTGYPSAKTAIEALRCRVLAYLVKPVPVPEFIAQVQAGVRHHAALRAISAILQSLDANAGELRTLQSGIRASMGRPAEAPFRILSGIVSRTIDQNVVELCNLIDVLLRTNSGEELVRWNSSARPLQLLAAIQDAVHVIERTRTTFRSQDLGQLRLRLQALIDASSVQPGAAPAAPAS